MTETLSGQSIFISFNLNQANLKRIINKSVFAPQSHWNRKIIAFGHQQAHIQPPQQQHSLRSDNIHNFI